MVLFIVSLVLQIQGKL